MFTWQEYIYLLGLLEKEKRGTKKLEYKEFLEKLETKVSTLQQGQGEA